MSRAKVEAMWLKHIEALEGGTENTTRYKTLFKNMSNDAFKELMLKFRDKKAYPALVVPIGGNIKLSAKRSQNVCKDLGVNLYQRVYYTDKATGERLLTPVKRMVYHLAIKRQNQHLVKKQSIPQGDRVLDSMTGQVTGIDKGSRVSMPEALVLNGKGIEHGLVETMKVRGGDKGATSAMKQSIRETGGYSLAPIVAAGTKPTVVHTLSAILLAMHLDNSLGMKDGS